MATLERCPFKRPILRVRLNKLSSDWQVARALLDDGYRTISKASDKIRNRYAFAVHLLDVHRMWCTMCSEHHPRSFGGRSDRDAAACESAAFGPSQHDQDIKSFVSASTQTTDSVLGLHSNISDVGLSIGLQDNHREVEDSKTNMMREMTFPIAMTSDGFVQSNADATSTENPQDNKRDEGSYLQGANQFTDQPVRVFIKLDGPTEESFDQGEDRSGSTPHQGHQEGIPNQLIKSDVQSEVNETNHVSDAIIKQERPTKESCDQGVGRNGSTSHQGHEERIPNLHIISDVLSELGEINHVSDVIIKQERPTKESCGAGVDCSRNQFTSHQEHAGATPTQNIQCDEPINTNSNIEPSSFTHDEGSAVGSSRDLFDKPTDSIVYNSETRRSDYTKHLRRHNCEKPFRCFKCKQDFTQQRQLKSHIRTHTGVKYYSDSTYNSAWKKNGDLFQCIKTHTGEKRHQCSICKKAFSHSSYLCRHIRTHTGEKPYQCSICNKAYSECSNLSAHIKTHTGEKPYQCSICNKAFSTRRRLSIHIRTHTGEKPYQCSICNKAFSDNSNLYSHIRTHRGEKPYQCSVCNKDFKTSGNLSGHMRTHTGERPYQCSVCDMAFTNRSSLTYHTMKIHTSIGDNPYQCSLCNKTFMGKSDLSRHMTTHTRE